MDNFKLIYRILHFLEKTSKNSEFDEDNFTPEHFGVEDEFFKRTLKMMYDRNFFSELTIKVGADGYYSISGGDPIITLTGLEYLHNNENMTKESEKAKGIK